MVIATYCSIRIYFNPNFDGAFLPKSWRSDNSEKKIQKNLECNFLGPELFQISGIEH